MCDVCEFFGYHDECQLTSERQAYWKEHAKTGIKATQKIKKLLKSSTIRDYLRKIEGTEPAVRHVDSRELIQRIKERQAGAAEKLKEMRTFAPAPLDPRKEAFSALANLKKRVQGTPHQDQRSWDVLAHAVADYVAQGKRETGMWIEVTESGHHWMYELKRRNGKGGLFSELYTSRPECVRMAQKTAKLLGIRYKEVGE
jgi:hypothetical protein